MGFVTFIQRALKPQSPNSTPKHTQAEDIAKEDDMTQTLNASFSLRA